MKSKTFTYSLLSATLVLGSFALVTACSDSQASKAKPNIVTKDSPKAGVVARIGGEEITEADLVAEDKMEFFELKKREYELKMDRINRLMVEKLIGAEAKKANLPLDEFIDKKIVKGETKISDSEFKKFVADKKIPESQLNPQIRDRINQYLQGQKKQELIQAYVAKITKSQPVEVYFARPALDVKVEVGSAPVTTTKDTKVTIIEFSDFQCPFCARGAEVVQELKKAYGSKVKIAFRHFPLPMHKEARPASEASMCVNEQSTDKFWKFHDILFKNQQSLDNESLAKYAKEAGADVAKFKACFESKKYAKQVQEDMEYGEKIGVRSTPTFFVNGQIVNGAVPKEQFDELISEAMASK